MDLGKMAQDQLDQALGDKKTKKTSKAPKSTRDSLVDDIMGNVDAAVKSKIPRGEMTDIAESTLDQNKDGHIVDDILRIGENLFKKNK